MKLSKFIENQTELVEIITGLGSYTTEEQTINGNELSKFIAEINRNISNKSLYLLEKQIAVIKKRNQYETEVEEAFGKTFGNMRKLQYHRCDEEYGKSLPELLDIYYSCLELLDICGDKTYDEENYDIFYRNPTIELMDNELVRLDKEIENFRKKFPKIAEDYKDLQNNPFIKLCK